jgi:hypothetical protein
MDMNHEINKLCRAIAEMAENCNHDLVGQHRENYNPRIMAAYFALLKLYPLQMSREIAHAELFGG